MYKGEGALLSINASSKGFLHTYTYSYRLTLPPAYSNKIDVIGSASSTSSSSNSSGSISNLQ